MNNKLNLIVKFTNTKIILCEKISKYVIEFTYVDIYLTFLEALKHNKNYNNDVNNTHLLDEIISCIKKYDIRKTDSKYNFKFSLASIINNYKIYYITNYNNDEHYDEKDYSKFIEFLNLIISPLNFDIHTTQ